MYLKELRVSIKTNSDVSNYEVADTTRTTTQLTTFAEVAPEIVDKVPNPLSIVPRLSNPYEKQDLEKVLSRKYLVERFTWAPGDLFGINLGTVSFPKALFAIPNIQDKLAQFRWIRSDVSIEVRLNTTPFHIGALMISWLPRTSTAGTTAQNCASHIASRSFNNAMVISASSVNNITFDIPRLAPTMMDEAHNDGDGQIGTMWVDVLNQLTLAGQDEPPSAIEVSIFASFKNPEVMGYGYTVPSASRIKQMIRETVKKQSGTVDPVAKESQKKSTLGIISGALDALSSFAPLVASTPFAEFSPILGAAGSLSQFASSVGLSKPASVQATQPTVNDPFRDINYGHGLSYATKLALHPDAKIADTDICGFKKNLIRDMVGMPSLIGSFTLADGTPTDTPLLLFPVSPGLAFKEVTAPKAYLPTMAGFLSQMFKSYRGGMKFKFQFITSAFVTARIRISHFPSQDLPASLEEYAGDLVSAVVDIRGDTDFEFTVPYLSPHVYSDVPGYYGVGDTTYTIPTNQATSWLSVSMINGVQQPTTTGNAVIYCNIWAAGAEDLTYINFSDFSTRKPAGATPMPEKQSVRMAYNKSFPPLAPALATMEAGLVAPEHYTSIEELTHRINTIVLPAPNVLSDTLVNNLEFFATSTDTLTHLAFIFRYYRGGLRYMAFTPPPATGDPSKVRACFTTAVFESYPSEEGPTTLAALSDNSLNPMLSWETPWMSTSYARSIYTSEYPEDAEGANEVTLFVNLVGTPWIPMTLGRSTADDWMFGFPLAPSPLFFTTAAVKKEEKQKEQEIDQSLIRKYIATSSPTKK